MEEMVKEEYVASVSIPVSQETYCWGCGFRLLLSSYAPVFKCGWCGAITNQNPRKHETRCYYRWRRVRDQFFVTTVLLFMLFVICGGVWAVYPVIFSVSVLFGVFHSIVTFILSVSTISSFSLAAFRSPGAPANMLWGSYPVVEKGGLENYTYCAYCAKPKSPRTHHCRSCGMCVLDMDHHCPFVFSQVWRVISQRANSPNLSTAMKYEGLGEDIWKIGNCVGAGNHRYFIAFLSSAVISTMYASAMCAYAGFHLWHPLTYGSVSTLSIFSRDAALTALKEIVHAFLSSAFFLSARGLVLVYLAIASLSIQIGIGVLLWQQLQFIYQGKTYISHLSAQDSGSEAKGCQNLFRFFGCPYWASRFLLGSSNSGKSHKK